MDPDSQAVHTLNLEGNVYWEEGEPESRRRQKQYLCSLSLSVCIGHLGDVKGHPFIINKVAKHTILYILEVQLV